MVYVFKNRWAFLPNNIQFLPWRKKYVTGIPHTIWLAAVAPLSQSWTYCSLVSLSLSLFLPPSLNGQSHAHSITYTDVQNAKIDEPWIVCGADTLHTSTTPPICWGSQADPLSPRANEHASAKEGTLCPATNKTIKLHRRQITPVQNGKMKQKP